MSDTASTHAASPVGDSAAKVLAGLADAQARIDAGEVDRLRWAAAWADLHSADVLAAGVERWQEQATILGGAGTPAVAEFCVAELAAALGMSTDAGADLMGDALELRHRLPRLWCRLGDGSVRAWKARRVARVTRGLSPAAAGFVDTHVAAVAGGVGPAALDRIVDAALAHHDPEALAARHAAAAQGRHLTIETRQLGCDGATAVSGLLDSADALDLDQALARRARHLAELGCEESLDVRRAAAVGELARADLHLDLPTSDGADDDAGADGDGDTDGAAATARPSRPGRRVVLHVHLTQAALSGVGVARVEELRGTHAVVSAEQVRAWCAGPGTTVVVRPVLDLADASAHAASYEIPQRIRDQVLLREPTCVFPWCHRPSRRLDLDHIDPWRPPDDGGGGGGGSTSPPNLAPLCRRHHRLKTHGRWRYRSPEPGTYTWTSPHGLQFTVTRGLTIPSRV